MPGPRSEATRRRILDTTRRLLAESGTTGTGLQQIVAASGVAYGSLYHQFPDGKDELVAAAIDDAGEDLGALIAGLLAADGSLPDAVRTMFAAGCGLLETTGFRQGCPVGTATADGHLVEPVRQAADGAFTRWTGIIADGAVRSGVGEDAAEALATAVLALYEGGLLLARTQHSLTPMQDAAEAAVRLAAAAVDA